MAIDSNPNRRTLCSRDALLLVALLVGGCAPERSSSVAPVSADAQHDVTTAAESAQSRTVAVPADSVPADSWTLLLDGSSLAGWRVLDEFDFSGHGPVTVEDGAVILEAGEPMTGIAWTGQGRDVDLPRDGYELRLEAKRLEGSDFYCGLTFPVAEQQCTLIVGGWGGSVVGLSNVDDLNASENETTTGIDVEDDRWYAIRLRVTAASIEVWIDDERVIELDRPGRRFDIWIQQEPAKPLGVVTYFTKAAIRNVRVRRV